MRLRHSAAWLQRRVGRLASQVFCGPTRSCRCSGRAARPLAGSSPSSARVSAPLRPLARAARPAAVSSPPPGASARSGTPLRQGLGTCSRHRRPACPRPSAQAHCHSWNTSHASAARVRSSPPSRRSSPAGRGNLTRRSSGRSKACCARLSPPLISNVGPQRVRQVVRVALVRISRLSRPGCPSVGGPLTVGFAPKNRMRRSRAASSLRERGSAQRSRRPSPIQGTPGCPSCGGQRAAGQARNSGSTVSA